MTKPFDIYAGKWWRYDRYEIRDGFIQPAKGAVLIPYDPWEKYRMASVSAPTAEGNLPKRRTQTPPYVSLLKLLDDVKLKIGTKDNPYLLTPESESFIADWCSENGLLGLLPHQTHSITLSTQWQDKPPTFPFHTEQEQYIRTAQGWKSVLTGWSSYCETEQEVPCPSDEDLLGVGIKPKVLLQRSIINDELIEEPLSQTWGKFFPDIPNEKQESYKYPLPLTSEWWSVYGEPVDAFLNAARVFRDALEALKTDVSNLGDDEMALEFDIGLQGINTLISAVGMSVHFQSEANEYRQRLSAPSLLASFATMASIDLTLGNKNLLRCETCQQYFVSQSYQAKYCTQTCQGTAAKRRQRDKKKGLQNK
jgi:hypothetical protein